MNMCFNKNKKQEKEISIPDIARNFYKEKVKFVYEVEKDRENSILEQAGRMLVVESIIVAAYCQIFSIIISQDYLFEDFSKVFLVLGILLVLSLIITLFSQNRYIRRSVPDIREIKECISKKEDYDNSEELDFFYTEEYIEKMYYSLKKLNGIRRFLLLIAIIILSAIFIITLVVVVI